MRLKLFATLLLGCSAAWAQTGTTAAVKQPASFDLSAIDKSADPCEDFYQYSCGGWDKSHPLPADKARYGRFDELQEYNRQLLHELLEEAAKPGPRTPIAAKTGDFYAACMDTAAVEKKGTTPIAPLLAAIGRLQSRRQIVRSFALLGREGIDAGFGFGIGPDAHNASMNIAQIDQGGLTLPDRDYYIKDEKRMADIRTRYLAHIEKMFTLLGETPAQAAADAKTVLEVETKLAQAEMGRVERRDPKNTDHKMTVAQLKALAPAVDFDSFFLALQVRPFTSLNVGDPGYFKQFNEALKTLPLASWKTYLRWHVLNDSARFLPAAFDTEHFEFFGKFLRGQKEQEARWKRCSTWSDAMLGEALGQLYVAKAYPPEAKKRMDVLVAEIEKSMSLDIGTLDWMSAGTQKAAEAKLAMVENKIGYPDKWKDYSKVRITRNDLIGNVRQASLFELNRNLNKLDKKVDKAEWDMTPPTVNAYYDPEQNNINFPAGILQAPFFSASVDDAVNYGAIGVVIGHELTHAFDDEGRQYDGNGNLNDWWGPKDGPEFDKRANCLVEQYGGFSPVNDEQGKPMHINGKLTLGENTADNGGLKLAFLALQRELAADPSKNTPVDGYTPAQRFFIGFAQVWCQNTAEQHSREALLTDPHSPGKYRVIGVVQNSEEFGKAFGCKKGQKMTPATSCHVW